ncbi:MAG: glycosyltransferase [Acidobacteriota bacterium]
MSEASCTGLSPGVSVIVVTYNDRDRLIDCLRSLENQAVQSATTEIIVIDDGSTDGTAEAVRDLFPGVRVITKANEGADLSRNRGITESSGNIIAFIDSDCVAPGNWLEILVGVLEKDPSAVVGGRVIHRGPFLRRVVGIADFGEYQGLVQREVRSLPTCNLGLARLTLGGVRFDPRLANAGGDTLFTETLRRGGATLIYEPEVAVEHRPSVTFGDLMRRAGRYGASFVRARQVDPSMRYAGLVRVGVLGVGVATAARVLLDWGRLVRHRRAAGFSLFEVPAAAVVLALRRLASLPAAVRAVRG